MTIGRLPTIPLWKNRGRDRSERNFAVDGSMEREPPAAKALSDDVLAEDVRIMGFGVAAIHGPSGADALLFSASMMRCADVDNDWLDE